MKINRIKILDLSLVFIVTFLSCWLFWETIGRNYIENYIEENYGYAIMETRNNSFLILKLDPNES